jgi:hypothetical protein
MLALTAAELSPVAQEAVALLAATELSPAQVAELNSVQYQIGTLGGAVLGQTNLGSELVQLDATASGYGWSLDPNTVAPGRMDLLTVVEHELGHVLGQDDVDPSVAPNALMTMTLASGVRRVVSPSDGLEAVESAQAPLQTSPLADPTAPTGAVRWAQMLPDQLSSPMAVFADALLSVLAPAEANSAPQPSLSPSSPIGESILTAFSDSTNLDPQTNAAVSDEVLGSLKQGDDLSGEIW